MATIGQVARAIGFTARDQLLDLAGAMLTPLLRQAVHQAVIPNPPPSRFLLGKLLTNKAVDGAIVDGVIPQNAYAKYALPKGLPTNGKRSLAIENDPHTVDDFDGVIEEGYGKGTKTLLYSGTGIVKIGRKSFPSKINYHVHDADVAGLHYDLVASGVAPGTKQWELHIPSGANRGRYAFVTTPKGMICVPMKDEGLVIPKPDYSLRPVEFLDKVKAEPGKWIVEHKIDGSLANVTLKNNRAAFRSHREAGQTYYDRLPQLEHVGNSSPFLFYRLLEPGPKLNGTVLRGELYHPDGAGRMGGILNAYPDKARQIQQLRGEATFHGWDIVKYKGKTVSGLPYIERRAALEQAIGEIRRFNRNWYVVEALRPGQDPQAFYRRITAQPLPWGEGIVIKDADNPGTWYKVKQTDFADLEVLQILEGAGKYANSVGRLVVRHPDTGGTGEVGSFSITDAQRDWIWQNRDKLLGSIAKVRVQEMTKSGAPRAGVFMGFHEGKGSEAGLYMYAESLAGGDPQETERTKYKLISSAGWRR